MHLPTDLSSHRNTLKQFKIPVNQQEFDCFLLGDPRRLNQRRSSRVMQMSIDRNWTFCRLFSGNGRCLPPEGDFRIYLIPPSLAVNLSQFLLYTQVATVSFRPFRLKTMWSLQKFADPSHPPGDKYWLLLKLKKFPLAPLAFNKIFLVIFLYTGLILEC